MLCNQAEIVTGNQQIKSTSIIFTETRYCKNPNYRSSGKWLYEFLLERNQSRGKVISGGHLLYFKLQKLYHRLNQPITGTRFHFDLRTIIHKTKRLTHSQHKNVKKKKKKIENKEEKWKKKQKSIFTLVSPAIGATLHTFLALNVFMMELFPTLG